MATQYAYKLNNDTRIHFQKAKHSAVAPTAARPVVQSNPPEKAKAAIVIEDLVLPDASKWISRFDVERELQWRIVSGPTRGLHNLGNTCFLNSSLQCLASTPALMQYLSSNEHSRRCRIPEAEHCILCELEGLLGCMHDASKGQKAYAPKWLADNIRVLGRQFRPCRQEDAHELLRRLLEHGARVSLRNAGVKEGAPGRLDETTPLHRIFGGYFRNQVHCPECGYDSNTFDSFMDLSLEVDGRAINTVPRALAHFAKPEVLDAKNKWKCPRCNKAVQARKQLTVRMPPAVLTVQLKRFSFTPRAALPKHGGNPMRAMMASFFGGGAGFSNKLRDHIGFDTTLDISPCMSDTAVREGQPSKYRLHGVLVHHGSTVSSGHYFSFTRAANDAWYCCDDSSVSRVGWNIVQQQMAYILFYSREPGQPAPLGGPLAAAFSDGMPAAATVAVGVNGVGAPKKVLPVPAPAPAPRPAAAADPAARKGAAAPAAALSLADLARVTYAPGPAPPVAKGKAGAPLRGGSAPGPWSSSPLVFTSTTPRKELSLMVELCQQDAGAAAALDAAKWHALRQRFEQHGAPHIRWSALVQPAASSPWDIVGMRRDIAAARAQGAADGARVAVFSRRDEDEGGIPEELDPVVQRAADLLDVYMQRCVSGEAAAARTALRDRLSSRRTKERRAAEPPLSLRALIRRQAKEREWALRHDLFISCDELEGGAGEEEDGEHGDGSEAEEQLGSGEDDGSSLGSGCSSSADDSASTPVVSNYVTRQASGALRKARGEAGALVSAPGGGYAISGSDSESSDASSDEGSGPLDDSSSSNSDDATRVGPAPAVGVAPAKAAPSPAPQRQLPLERVEVTANRRRGAFDPATFSSGGKLASGGGPSALLQVGLGPLSVPTWGDSDAEEAVGNAAAGLFASGGAAAAPRAPPAAVLLHAALAAALAGRAGPVPAVKRNRWGDDATTGRALDEEEGARMTGGEWNDRLDLGRVKKVKVKEEPEEGEAAGQRGDAGNVYQRVHDDRRASQSALTPGEGYRKGAMDSSHGNYRRGGAAGGDRRASWPARGGAGGGRGGGYRGGSRGGFRGRGGGGGFRGGGGSRGRGGGFR